ncbi:MAG: VOC family protein [Mariniphaga sp.]|nr:VOC family protein [Mariniphaga sp.]
MKIFINFFWLILFFAGSTFQLHAQTIKEIQGVSITVSDMNKALNFYTEVLPFEKDTTFTLQGKSIQNLYNVQDTSLKVTVARLYIGEEHIELIEFHSENNVGREIPADSRSNDLWFQHIAIVVSDMQKAWQILEENDVTHVSTSPQTLPDYLPAAAGISAFYFRDPDGHNLELIHFPQGKGNPKWQNSGDKLFLGIDHTAIGIESTRTSLQFYQDVLGLNVAGESVNYGTEQEHLNQVFGARLKITGLTAANGIGLEFLDYIAPPGGRPYPADTKPNDLWYWHTTLKVKGINGLFQKLKEQGYSMLSENIVELGSSGLGGNFGFIARDTDGHALLFLE